MDNAFRETISFLKQYKYKQPHTGIVLGTGLGGIIKSIDIEHEISYAHIPHFPESTVESHEGKLIFGTISQTPIVAMQGRFHYYEGYGMQQIVYPIRIMKILGVQQLIISNAAGAINKNFSKARLMLIDDHINLLPDNPLRGKNPDYLGPRFPDMSEPYNKNMNARFRQAAKALKIHLYQGVYASVMGPNLETRAEYRYLHTIGADAVGMSTVPEVIAANHMNLPCAAISVLTDECDPDNLVPVSLKEILAAAATAEPHLIQLILAFIKSTEA